jgi:hypothetical protein
VQIKNTSNLVPAGIAELEEVSGFQSCQAVQNSRLPHPPCNHSLDLLVRLHVVIECRRVDEDDVSAPFVSRVSTFDTLNVPRTGCQAMVNRQLIAIGSSIDELAMVW